MGKPMTKEDYIRNIARALSDAADDQYGIRFRWHIVYEVATSLLEGTLRELSLIPENQQGYKSPTAPEYTARALLDNPLIVEERYKQAQKDNMWSGFWDVSFSKALIEAFLLQNKERIPAEGTLERFNQLLGANADNLEGFIDPNPLTEDLPQESNDYKTEGIHPTVEGVAAVEEVYIEHKIKEAGGEWQPHLFKVLRFQKADQGYGIFNTFIPLDKVDKIRDFLKETTDKKPEFRFLKSNKSGQCRLNNVIITISEPKTACEITYRDYLYRMLNTGICLLINIKKLNSIEEPQEDRIVELHTPEWTVV